MKAKSGQYRPVTGPQLAQSVVAVIRYPDVDPVKRYSRGARADSKDAQDRAITGPQLANCEVIEVGYPDVGPVEGQCPWRAGGGHSRRKARCLVRLIPTQNGDLVGILG